MNKDEASSLVSLFERLATSLRDPTASDTEREALFRNGLASLDARSLNWMALRITGEQEKRGAA